LTIREGLDHLGATEPPLYPVCLPIIPGEGATAETGPSGADIDAIRDEGGALYVVPEDASCEGRGEVP